MHLRLTDGTHDIEIDTPHGRGTPFLGDIEDTARRLLDHLRTPHPDTTPPADDTHPFGFTHHTTDQNDAALGTALGSDTERAEPYIEPGHDLDEYDDRRQP